jgi:hypothetical protein
MSFSIWWGLFCSYFLFHDVIDSYMFKLEKFFLTFMEAYPKTSPSLVRGDEGEGAEFILSTPTPTRATLTPRFKRGKVSPPCS